MFEVPVVVRDGPTNPYAQVAEKQKRHRLTPLDLARFIRGRIDAGDSNTTVAKALGARGGARGQDGAAGPGRAAQLLSRATGLREKLDATLMRLGPADLDALPSDDVASLRQRIAQLASRIGG